MAEHAKRKTRETYALGDEPPELDVIFPMPYPPLVMLQHLAMKVASIQARIGRHIADLERFCLDMSPQCWSPHLCRMRQLVHPQRAELERAMGDRCSVIRGVPNREIISAVEGEFGGGFALLESPFKWCGQTFASAHAAAFAIAEVALHDDFLDKASSASIPALAFPVLVQAAKRAYIQDADESRMQTTLEIERAKAEKMGLNFARRDEHWVICVQPESGKGGGAPEGVVGGNVSGMDPKEALLMTMFLKNPTISTRKASETAGVSRNTAGRRRKEWVEKGLIPMPPRDPHSAHDRKTALLKRGKATTPSDLHLAQNK